MTPAAPQQLPRMTSDEFLVWTETQPDGKFELHDGVVVSKGEPLDGAPTAMAGERRRHSIVKGNAFGLLSAVASPCRAYVDGMAIRVSETQTYLPDVLVDCGDQSDMDGTISDLPMVVLEVLSRSTAHLDLGRKLEGYFAVLSVHHYLLIDPQDRRVIHHQRDADIIATSIQSTGDLDLTPPGLTLSVDALWQGLPDEEAQA
jgi:Uma2 family endonuclease